MCFTFNILPLPKFHIPKLNINEMDLGVIMKNTKFLPNLEGLKLSVINCILPLHIVFYSFLYKKKDKRHKNAGKHSTLKVSPDFFFWEYFLHTSQLNIFTFHKCGVKYVQSFMSIEYSEGSLD